MADTALSSYRGGKEEAEGVARGLSDHKQQHLLTSGYQATN
jgi:hypothetical protein